MRTHSHSQSDTCKQPKYGAIPWRIREMTRSDIEFCLLAVFFCCVSIILKRPLGSLLCCAPSAYCRLTRLLRSPTRVGLCVCAKDVATRFNRFYMIYLAIFHAVTQISVHFCSFLLFKHRGACPSERQWNGRRPPNYTVSKYQRARAS